MVKMIIIHFLRTISAILTALRYAEIRKVVWIGLQKKYPFPSLSNSEHISLTINWMLNAQKHNKDGGIPVKYSLKTNSFYPSYPETSGYILSSFITYHKHYKDISTSIQSLKNYLLSTQIENGGFSGGHAKMSN